MIAGPRTVQRSSRAPGLDHDVAVDLRVDQLALDARARRVSRISRLASSMSSRRPGVLPPAAHDVRLDARPGSTRCWIASVISSSPRADGSIARAASWMPRREHVDADEREVGLRLGRLLHEAGRPGCPRRARPRRSSRGRGTCVRRISASGSPAAEGVDEVLDPALQQVVAQVHHERRVGQERLGGQDGVGQPERLVLLDVGDRHPEAATRRPRPRGSRRPSPGR